MHGGFENETPNIPTNSIMKIDLMALVKGNQNLTQKLEQACGANPQRSGSSPNSNNKSGSSSPSDGNNNSTRATTPPMQSLAKQNNTIKIGKVEVELYTGEKPKTVSLNELEEERNKGLSGGNNKGGDQSK
jgi:hypothetical protein